MKITSDMLYDSTLKFHIPELDPILMDRGTIVVGSSGINFKPSVSEVDLPTAEELIKAYESCPGCGASRIKNNKCEYCGRKH